MQRAAALYAGPLVSVEEDEADGHGRDVGLRGRLVRQLNAAASALERADGWPQVVDLVEDALRIDPCNEDAYARLMIAHHRLGHAAGVRAIYERCRRCLAMNAGRQPCQRIEDLMAHFATPRGHSAPGPRGPATGDQ